jgi:ADP-ribose pyrophosphatase YjhB (NUDIX family)
MMCPAHEVLLMETNLPWLGPVWIVPGGGVEQRESLRDTARREAFEETGVALNCLGQELWWGDVNIEHEGRRVLLREHYVFAETEKFVPSQEMLEEYEKDWFLYYRWWCIEKIEASVELFALPEIGNLLRQFISGGAPSSSVQLRNRIHVG